MKNIDLDNKFYETCFTLSVDDILTLDKIDNGPLNNVISNISKECFGVQLFKDEDDFTVEMFYVTKTEQLKGDLISLKLNDPDYFYLLFRFCHLIAVSYKEVDTIDAFNTFQIRLQSFLGKLGYFTVTSLELKMFEGQQATMFFPSKKVRAITLIDKVEYYRDFFGNNYKTSQTEHDSFVYLMINTDSSLIKIGYSRNPRYREKTLHSQEPGIHLIACWPTERIKEKELHNKYELKRVRGEWFRLNLADLKGIEDFMRDCLSNQ